MKRSRRHRYRPIATRLRNRDLPLLSRIRWPWPEGGIAYVNSRRDRVRVRLLAREGRWQELLDILARGSVRA